MFKKNDSKRRFTKEENEPWKTMKRCSIPTVNRNTNKTPTGFYKATIRPVMCGEGAEREPWHWCWCELAPPLRKPVGINLVPQDPVVTAFSEYAMPKVKVNFEVNQSRDVQSPTVSHSFFFSLQIYWGFWIPEKLVEKTQVCIKFLIRS